MKKGQAMLLRNITKHVKDQNWFAVSIDFFIVVAGILIALQITNWSEARREHGDLAEAEIALKVDLYQNYFNSQERLSFVDCRIAHHRELAVRLLDLGDRWEGMARYDSDNADRFAIEPVLRSPNRIWGSRIWEAKLALGTFNHIFVSRIIVGKKAQ